LDLGSKRSIERFAESIKVKYGKVDILVNNAGLMGLPERQLSKEGYEMQMAVNHLGHFYLTYLLWDILKNSENLRIINVSSKSHLRNYIDSNAQSTIDFNTMDGSYPGLGMQHGRYHPMYAYSASKMANVLFTQ
jgi:retinol dehydrogenase-12